MEMNCMAGSAFIFALCFDFFCCAFFLMRTLFYDGPWWRMYLYLYHGMMLMLMLML